MRFVALRLRLLCVDIKGYPNAFKFQKNAGGIGEWNRREEEEEEEEEDVDAKNREVKRREEARKSKVVVNLVYLIDGYYIK